MTLFQHNNLNPDLISLSCENMSFQGQDLVIGNVGDSRAVLATRDKDDSLLAVQLTVDLKPDLPSLSLSLSLSLSKHTLMHTFMFSCKQIDNRN